MQPTFEFDLAPQVTVDTGEGRFTYSITESAGVAHDGPAHSDVQFFDLHYAELLGVPLPDYGTGRTP